MKVSPAASVYCAIDTPDATGAAALVRQIGPHVGGIKLGLELFCALGPDAVRAIAGDGVNLFLDLKFHDIPNTVAGAVRAVMPLQPRILTVHAAGGPAMLQAARMAAREFANRVGIAPPRIVAVTVLTSLDGDDLAATGVMAAPAAQVLRLAALARAAGLDGVVCSPQEVASVRAAWPDGYFVVPGIRPAGSETSDQKRTMDPAAAQAAGASVLVIGRPITQAADPAAAARTIAASLQDR